RADIHARPEAFGDQLGRSAADVDDDGSVVERPDAAQCHRSLLVAAQEARRECERPLDLPEECLAVLRIAHGACRDGEGPLGAERFELPPVLTQRVPDASDRDGEEAPARVNALAELRDARSAHQFLNAPVVDIGDEEARGVRAQVDRRNAHYLRGTARRSARMLWLTSSAAERRTASCASDAWSRATATFNCSVFSLRAVAWASA